MTFTAISTALSFYIHCLKPLRYKRNKLLYYSLKIQLLSCTVYQSLDAKFDVGEKACMHAFSLPVEVSYGTVKIYVLRLLQFLLKKNTKHVSSYMLNIGHNSKAISKLLKYLMKLHDETNQIESHPEAIPYPSWIIYEYQLLTRLLF